MDELKPPHLYDLLESLLIGELGLICADHIDFISCWKYPGNADPSPVWVCDVYEDSVNVRRGGTFYAADPDFLRKVRNACTIACDN